MGRHTQLTFLLLSGVSALGQVTAFDEGLALYRNGRLQEAIERFGEVRKANKNNPLVDFYQGVCFAKSGNLQAALPMLRTYILVQPADPHGWYWLSRIELLLKQFDEARTAIQRAIALDAKSSDAFRTLGEVELELHNNDAAYRAWIRANKLNPADAQNTYHLGRLFFEAEFFSEATEWLRETLRLVPSHFSAATYLGLCAEYLGDDIGALELYRSAIAQSKQQKAPFALAYLSYAKLLRQKGRDSEALALLEESERLCPNPSALSILGQMLAAEQQSERAEAVLRRAIEMDPGVAEAHYRLSLLLRAKGDADTAKAEMKNFENAKKMEERNRNAVSAMRVQK